MEDTRIKNVLKEYCIEFGNRFLFKTNLGGTLMFTKNGELVYVYLVLNPDCNVLDTKQITILNCGNLEKFLQSLS